MSHAFFEVTEHGRFACTCGQTFASKEVLRNHLADILMTPLSEEGFVKGETLELDVFDYRESALAAAVRSVVPGTPAAMVLERADAYLEWLELDKEEKE